MKVALCYIFPDLDHATYYPLAKRFVKTYMEHPPGLADHEINVMVTLGSGRMIDQYAKVFHPLPCRYYVTDNMGKDIGAYQIAAETIPCDLLVCLGAPVHFYRAGWLDRMVEAYEQNGPALYGCRGYNTPMHHVRTTAFWLPPQLLDSYPYIVTNNSRYEFEHGARSITMHTKSCGLECYMVTFNGCYPYDQWGATPMGANLMLDQWSERCGETE
jgi:hypothetical protein